jgi:ubiquinone/menaquinone biosynthesis C-methylase UbiE
MTLGDFSEQADAYKRSRPSYPEQLIDKLIAEASVQAGDSVADLGAGTGIFTELLVNMGFDVTAVDPNEAMMRQADLPGARWVNGTFEKTFLPDQSQDWAVAAQAFHWANPQLSLPEIRRILKPDSVFTAYRHGNWARIFESTGDFTFLSHHVASHTVAMSRDRYLELWRSHNRLNSMAGPDRFASFINDLRASLEQRQVSQVAVPYRCEAWSARRND